MTHSVALIVITGVAGYMAHSLRGASYPNRELKIVTVILLAASFAAWLTR